MEVVRALMLLVVWLGWCQGKRCGGGDDGSGWIVLYSDEDAYTDIFWLWEMLVAMRV